MKVCIPARKSVRSAHDNNAEKGVLKYEMGKNGTSLLSIG